MSSPQDSQKPFLTAPCQDFGIDALDLLVRRIVTEVQTLTNTTLREGIHGNLVLPMLQPLHDAFAQGLAIIAGLMNAVAPINRIPPELLTRIFALSPRTISTPPRRATPGQCKWPFQEIVASDLHELLKVCRYWRDLALAMPTLWTTISTHTFRTTVANGVEKSWFRRSVYLPDDSRVGLVVHYTKIGRISENCREKMTEFMVKKAPRLRELHVWSTSAIRDFPLFLRSLDASILEHCTLWDIDDWQDDREPSPETGILPLFCKGGGRLRSLSLSGIEALPSNVFPALTLLLISVSRPFSRVCWDVSDLVKFFAGSPRLEEVHVHDLECSPLHPPSLPRSPGSQTPIALPCLRYLAFTCYRHDESDPVEYLLCHISIPSTCHMHFVVHDTAGNSVANDAIVDSVRRHINGKDAVSHVFLDSSFGSEGTQLVFSEGSLRLESPRFSNASTADHFAGLFHPFPELFARTADVRIVHGYYDAKDLASLLASSGSFLAMFPNLTAVTLVREFGDEPTPFSDATKCQDIDRAISPKDPQSDGEPDQNVDRRSIPWPALDTLWTSVQSWREIANLEATLVARTALGCPVRRVIVTVYYGISQEGVEGIAEQLRALSAEEVILMEVDVRSHSEFRAIDWMVTLPERFSLPSTIRRDWPTMWYRRK